MQTPHGKIIDETELSTLYDKGFMLLFNFRVIWDSLFCTLSGIVAIWDNFGGFNSMGFNYKFKELQILTVSCLYILEMIMFAIKNPDKCQNNDKIHTKDRRQKNQFHLQSVRLSSVQKGVYYSSKRISSNFLHTLYNYVEIFLFNKWIYVR
jgi:hypothetical protein